VAYLRCQVVNLFGSDFDRVEAFLCVEIADCHSLFPELCQAGRLVAEGQGFLLKVFFSGWQNEKWPWNADYPPGTVARNAESCTGGRLSIQRKAACGQCSCVRFTIERLKDRSTATARTSVAFRGQEPWRKPLGQWMLNIPTGRIVTIKDTSSHRADKSIAPCYHQPVGGV